MNRLFTLMMLVGLGFSTVAQDWTSDRSKLYYVSDEGKVFIEPDQNLMAVYFNETPTAVLADGLKSQFAQMRTSSGQEVKTNLMDLKGIVTLENVQGVASLGSSKERGDFLSSMGLRTQGAYEVLPGFNVQGEKAWLTKRVVIRLKDGVGFSQIQDEMKRLGASFVKNITDENTFLIQVSQIENQFVLIQDLEAQGLLDWGQPDFKMEIVRRIDPMYQHQWHLNNTGGTDLGGKALLNDADIDAPEAWGLATGNNVTVGVIDDGLENHEDMATLLTGYTPANNGNGTPSTSGDGHGQQCAGLIGALHNEIGVRGVAPGVSMFSINIFAPNTSNADVADGINWAVNAGADVLSNSWGFTSCTFNDASITAAFNNAANNGRGGLGCIILVASGNDFNTCVSYPADLPSVTAVGGISGDGGRSNFSNYGPALDIVAPSNDDWQFNAQGQLINTAHDLVTIDREGSAGWFSGNYSTGFGGTSGATPIAAGVAALVLSANPALTKSEVENILYTTSDDIGPSGFDNEYGHGRVNAYQAVLAAGGSSDTEAPTVPTGLSASNIADDSFTVSWNASSDNTAVTGYTVYLNGSSIGTVTGTSANVTGLNPSTNYSVAVAAFDASGNNSAQSSSINVTTTAAQCEDGPASMTLVTDQYASETSWTLTRNGSQVASGSGYANNSTYNISFDYGDGDYVFTINDSYGDGICCSYGNGSYTIRDGNNAIIATGGNFTNSATEEFCVAGGTPADTEAPSTPAGLASSNITTSSFDVSWNASSDNVGVDGYNVYLNGSSVGSTSSTSYSFSGLSANTTYSVAVEAYDAAGNTSGQGSINVTTTSGGGSGSDVLVQSYFESGWDGWQDGGSDCFRYSGSRSYEGNYSIRIRDNSGTGSAMTYSGVDLTGYDQVEIEFYFYSYSMENGEDFWVRFYNGSSWQTVATYARGSSFENNGFYTATVTLSSADYNFASNAGFRFQNDASGNNDHIYIDQVTITGSYGVGGSSNMVAFMGGLSASSQQVGDLSIDDEIRVFPNPVRNILTLQNVPETAQVRLITVSGKVISEGIGTESIDMSTLQTGLYLVQVTHEGETEVHRITKQD